MDLGAYEFIKQLPQGPSSTLIVGQNGSGKSRFLVELAQHFKRKSIPVIAISNTHFDRFSGFSGIERISAAWGKQLPSRLLKNAISLAGDEKVIRLEAIAQTLAYCNYDREFKVTVVGGPLIEELGFFNIRPYSSDDEMLAFIEEFQNRDDGRNIQLPLFSPIQLNNIRLAIDLLIAEQGIIHRTFDFTNTSIELSKNRDLAQIVGLEKALKKLGIITSISIGLFRDEKLVSLQSASSGELALITSLVFLATTLPENAILLIDEPENSLHLQWQKEYVRRLFDLLYYRQPTIIVATHAPVIVSGAQLVRDLPVGVFEARDNVVCKLSSNSEIDPPQNLEETLWKNFGLVTPKNNYVSKSLVAELDKVSNGELSADSVISVIESMANSSFDPKQLEFFNSVKELARRIERERSQRRSPDLG